VTKDIEAVLRKIEHWAPRLDRGVQNHVSGRTRGLERYPVEWPTRIRFCSVRKRR
jgi:hypothetical protein